jgi:hypothetical protein
MGLLNFFLQQERLSTMSCDALTTEKYVLRWARPPTFEICQKKKTKTIHTSFGYDIAIALTEGLWIICRTTRLEGERGRDIDIKSYVDAVAPRYPRAMQIIQRSDGAARDLILANCTLQEKHICTFSMDSVVQRYLGKYSSKNVRLNL